MVFCETSPRTHISQNTHFGGQKRMVFCDTSRRTHTNALTVINAVKMQRFKSFM